MMEKEINKLKQYNIQSSNFFFKEDNIPILFIYPHFWQRNTVYKKTKNKTLQNIIPYELKTNQ